VLERISKNKGFIEHLCLLKCKNKGFIGRIAVQARQDSSVISATKNLWRQLYGSAGIRLTGRLHVSFTRLKGQNKSGGRTDGCHRLLVFVHLPV